MPVGPSTPLSFSLAPSSSASSDTGLDNLGSHGGGYTGGVSIGAGAGDTWVTSLVRDLVILAGVVLAAKYAWKRMK